MNSYLNLVIMVGDGAPRHHVTGAVLQRAPGNGGLGLGFLESGPVTWEAWEGYLVHPHHRPLCPIGEIHEGLAGALPMAQVLVLRVNVLTSLVWPVEATVAHHVSTAVLGHVQNTRS